MILKDWCAAAGIPAESHASGGLFVVVEPSHNLRFDLFHLLDYAVSSVSGVVLWLVPRSPDNLVEVVKRKLPDVRVRSGRRVYFGRVSGAGNDSASVSAKGYFSGDRWVAMMGPIHRVPWDVVARAAVDRKPINLGDFALA